MIFLRPWFLLFLPIICLLGWYFWQKPGKHQDWLKVCDLPLFQFFQQGQIDYTWRLTWIAMMASLVLMVIALCGPSWQKKAVKMASIQEPVVIVMDLSTAMLLDDVSPNRLERTKLLIQDLLAKYPSKQWGFLVFSNMAYVVTPITTDTQNILNFLPVISPQILPSAGYDVQIGLQKAKQLLKQSAYESGQILVLSSKPPPQKTFDLPKFIDLAWVNIAPEVSNGLKTDYPQFYIKKMDLIEKWLKQPKLYSSGKKTTNQTILQYHDEGLWFLALALMPLIMVFRKGWLIRLWG